MPAHRFLFYTPALEPSDTALEITGDEHHHLVRVLRLREGESVCATNGRGLMVSGVLERVGTSSTRAAVTSVVNDRRTIRRLALALALLPRAHFEAAVSQCVELGITELVPLVAEKCRVYDLAGAASRRVERVMIAAMKQSFRAELPALRPPAEVESLAAMCGEFDHVVVGDGDAPVLAPPSRDADVMVIVGPEAGLTDSELSRLRDAGAAPASVSAHRLRAETAAVALVSAVARGI